MAASEPTSPPPEQRAGLRASWIDSDRALARLVGRPLRSFLEIEASGGLLLVLAAVVALVWVNSPWHRSYEVLWHTEVAVSVGRYHFEQSLLHVVNDGLMALFFFVIGLEIKREWVTGELRDRRAAVLPVVAAIGGMALPALLYLAVDAGTAGSHGWGIPMATDIAFALGVVALLGSRVPASLKVFLLTLAIVDDLGAIVVIAVVYSGDLRWGWLGVAALALAAMLGLRKARVRWLPVYVALGIVVWFATLQSGVHATIAGVVLGLITPAVPFHPPAAIDAAVDTIERRPGLSVEELRATFALLNESVAPLDRLEAALHPWTSYVIIPIFALANAGVRLGGGVQGTGARVTVGVVVGLVVGKAIGVGGASWLVVRLGWGTKPTGVSWAQFFGVAALAGIGFTMSLFVTDLAFAPTLAGAALTHHAKIGVLLASLLAALFGSLVLVLASRKGAAVEA